MALDFSIKESAILSEKYFFFEIAFERTFTSLSLHYDFNDLCKKKKVKGFINQGCYQASRKRDIF